MKQIIWPSLMCNSQKELNEDFKKLKGVVKTLHLDIVDGKFAPSKVMQFPFRLSSDFVYNAHLMIKSPEVWIKKNIKRINLFIPHFEEVKDKEEYIQWMKNEKKKVAFAIKPETKVSELVQYLNKIDYILVLTVHPGFYGAKYLPKNLDKIKQIKKINSKIKVIVDGGMNPKIIGKVFKVGADYFVSGSYTTKSDNPKQSIKNLMGAIKNG